MSFDELLERVIQRLTADPEHHAVMGESALAEANELWRAAQPADPDHLTRGETQRLRNARHILGNLFLLRYGGPSASRESLELARTIVFLAPLASDPAEIPEPLHGVLGPGADSDQQTTVAVSLLSDTASIADPHLPDAAITLLTSAMATTPADHPDRVERLNALGVAYYRRFGNLGIQADADRAIQLTEQALAAAPTDYPNRAAILSNLGGVYGDRFKRVGALPDLNRAIDLDEQALAAVPADHPHRAEIVHNLARSYTSRYERIGALEDLDRAIKLHEQALAAVPADYPYRAGVLYGLGVIHLRRFERTGAQEALDRAIELGEQTVAATSANHRDRAKRLSVLSGSYLRRFERIGVLVDLDRAIELGEQALAATPTNDPDRGATLSNLSAIYARRYGRIGVLVDLDRAIELGEQAAAATPTNAPKRSTRFANLGAAYSLRFDHVRMSPDLDRAIELTEQALAAASPDDPSQPGRLLNLSKHYLSRHDRSGLVADLDRAIELSQQGLAATPADHPNRAAYLRDHSNGLLRRLTRTGQDIDRETLRTLATEVSSATTASPAARVSAARAVGLLAQAMNDHATAVELFDTAVTMMPLVTPRESSWADQAYSLGAQMGLASEAVSAHCALDDPAGAVEAAELGRGVLLATHMNNNTDLSDLYRAHPDLAARFQHVRDQVNTPASGLDDLAAETVERIADRRRWWVEHDALLTQIRHRPDFSRFLLPPRLNDLRPATAGGTVVLVNAGRLRGDAIIVTSDSDPTCVSLPDLALDDVYAHARELLAATHDSRPLSGILRRKRVLPMILSWLWDTIVSPALNAIPPACHAGSSPPRIWWLPINLLSLFPLHAAGRPEQPGALDRVVSSYTPTLRALAHTRARPPATARHQLTVALTHTPGLPELPGIAAEAATLHAHYPGTPLLVGHDATTAGVLAALPSATWTHFACHASADLTTPSQGGLCLHDGTLSLPEIGRLQLSRAELAYLSACSTAHSGWWFADESLHLASAFQLAGFRHVIASLWPLNDHIAAAAAAAFYGHMPSDPAADRAATVLHQITRDLRAQHPDRPDLWAALIHSGP